MQRLIKTSCAIAAEELGKEKAAKIAEAAQRRYEALLIENAGDGKAFHGNGYGRFADGQPARDVDRPRITFCLVQSQDHFQIILC